MLIGSRVVVELGADLVKTFYTRDFPRSHVGPVPSPSWVWEREKLPTQRDALTLAQREVADGAGGVVFGRNAIQVPDPLSISGGVVRCV